MPKQDQDARLWAKVDTSAGPDACWPFTGHCDPEKGYGWFLYDGRGQPSHRAAYQSHHGVEILSHRIRVRHTCDNPPCCNPAHLVAGSNSANIRDMVAKGRGNFARGEAHYRATIGDKKIQRMRRMFATGRFTKAEVARRFKVSRPYTSRLLRGVRRKEGV